ncbi:(2Fe-2S)-binding protein [Brevibacillus massiliensis]|jgi:sarcosine oxidase subunit alpha|uniref:(2Fe-2S)-binding protein n=1 Tax=Brevibacillus massiliensis TaxID=1118054 RepID=UPI0002FA9A10|nr:(2Fe-2S)-binding protein [Brevibacillus massiliensis]
MEILHHPVLGELPDAERITIDFEGRKIEARPGQTVAFALMANGIVALGRSRKLRQARGVYCASGRCCSCFMTIDGREHVRACVTRVRAGMRIRQNTGDPQVGRDLDED